MKYNIKIYYNFCFHLNLIFTLDFFKFKLKNSNYHFLNSNLNSSNLYFIIPFLIYIDLIMCYLNLIFNYQSLIIGFILHILLLIIDLFQFIIFFFIYFSEIFLELCHIFTEFQIFHDSYHLLIYDSIFINYHFKFVILLFIQIFFILINDYLKFYYLNRYKYDLIYHLIYHFLIFDYLFIIRNSNYLFDIYH